MNFCINFLNLQIKQKYILNYVLRVNIKLINPSLFFKNFPSQAVQLNRKINKYPILEGNSPYNTIGVLKQKINLKKKFNKEEFNLLLKDKPSFILKLIVDFLKKIS